MHFKCQTKTAEKICITVTNQEDHCIQKPHILITYILQITYVAECLWSIPSGTA